MRRRPVDPCEIPKFTGLVLIRSFRNKAQREVPESSGNADSSLSVTTFSSLFVMCTTLNAQNAEPALFIVEGDTLHQSGQRLGSWARRRRHRHPINVAQSYDGDEITASPGGKVHRDDCIPLPASPKPPIRYRPEFPEADTYEVTANELAGRERLYDDSKFGPRWKSARSKQSPNASVVGKSDYRGLAAPERSGDHSSGRSRRHYPGRA